ncbi:hypothetical protein A2U01_0074008, partial [Trifolium medium]|nr:hypothetical protein [Trifolium medium]
EPEVVELNDQTSEDNSVQEVPATSMAKRLRSNTGKVVTSPNKLAKTTRAAKKTSEKPVMFGPHLIKGRRA